MQLTDLKFVSEKREHDFNKLNIYTVEALVRHYPRDYLDLRHVTLLKDAYHNDYILTAAEVTNVEVTATPAVRTSRRTVRRVKARSPQSGSTSLTSPKNSAAARIFSTAECKTATVSVVR